MGTARRQANDGVKLDKRFALVDAAGELHFPFRSRSRTTADHGFVVGADGQGTAFRVERLEDVIEAVVFKQRCALVTADIPGRPPDGRNLSLHANRLVRGYVIEDALMPLVRSAKVRPLGSPASYAKDAAPEAARMAVFGALSNDRELLAEDILRRMSSWTRAKDHWTKAEKHQQPFYVLLNEGTVDGMRTLVATVRGIQLGPGPSAVLDIAPLRPLEAPVPAQLLVEWHTGRQVLDSSPRADVPVVLSEELERLIVGLNEAGGGDEELVPAAHSAFVEIGQDPHNQHLTRTEVIVLANARVGQGGYRRRMLRIWGGRCSVTGVGIPDALVASHAAPWHSCTNDERLDAYNGLLLCATLDRLFESGLISFRADGSIVLSKKVRPEEWKRLGLSPEARLRFVHRRHVPYLERHQSAAGAKE